MWKLSKIIYWNSELRHFTFNYIIVDEKQFDIDGKQLKVLKELRKKITILKSDEGQGVALLKQEDYTNCLETLLAGRNKFNKLFNPGEINKEQ